MDPAYQNRLWVLATGAVLGAFLRAKVIAHVTAVLFALAATGLAITAFLDYGTAIMLFGLAAIAVPVLGMVAYAGAAISARVWRRKIK